MIRYEDDCVSCAMAGYMCLGKLCPYKNTPHFYCDECKEEEDLFYYEDDQLCIKCIEKRLKKVNAYD